EAHDRLGLRRPGLERGRDDDVVGTGDDVVPARRVEMMTPVNAGALRQGGHTLNYAGPEWPRKRTRPSALSAPADLRHSPAARASAATPQHERRALAVHVEATEEAHAEQPHRQGVVVDDHRVDVAHRRVADAYRVERHPP